MRPLEPIRREERIEPPAPARRVRRERSPSEEESAPREQEAHDRPPDEDAETDDGLPHIDVRV
ncbi:MAG: hypothetical protein ACJ757_09425 [Gaiellaceae bacterium]